MPIRLELPSSLMYFSIFGFLHPAHMSVSLEYIAMMKHETLPMCERLLRELNGRLEEELSGNNYGSDEEGDVELLSEIRVAEEQVEDRAKEKLKTVTMDIWSVLTNDNVVSYRIIAFFFVNIFFTVFSFSPDPHYRPVHFPPTSLAVRVRRGTYSAAPAPFYPRRLSALLH